MHNSIGIHVFIIILELSKFNLCAVSKPLGFEVTVLVFRARLGLALGTAADVMTTDFTEHTCILEGLNCRIHYDNRMIETRKKVIKIA